MKLHITESAVSSLARTAITARIVYGVLIDMPELLNAGWLSVLLGAVLALPIVLIVCALRKKASGEIPKAAHPVLFRMVCAVFFIITVCDSAAILSAISGSVSYMALNSIPSAYLLIPTSIVCAWCLLRNGDAIGTSAGIWNRFLPWLLGIMLLLEFKSFRPAWLTPVLGPGIPTLFSGAVRCGGWFALSSALYLIAEPGKHQKSRNLEPLKTLVVSSALSLLICMMHSMMTPAITDPALTLRSFRIDTLLANGRSTLALQLPSISLWFTSLLFLLLMDSFTSAALLERIFPSLDRLSSPIISVLMTVLLSFFQFSGRTGSLSLADWIYAAEFLSVICIALSLKKQERSSIACIRSNQSPH